VASVQSAESAAAAAAAAAAREILMKSSFPPLSNVQSSLHSSSPHEEELDHSAASFSSPTFPPPLPSSVAPSAALDLDPDSLRSWASARLKDTMRYVFAQVCHVTFGAPFRVICVLPSIMQLIMKCQASDGSLLFMQPINTRMLLHHISETGCLPPLADLPVLYATNTTIDEETRSRYKWMSHLPLFTPVTVVDVDLSAVVGEITMLAFKQELLHRSLRWTQVCLSSFAQSSSLSCRVYLYQYCLRHHRSRLH
jgi:hypothetical protein